MNNSPLYHKVCSIDTLFAAWQEVKKKGSAGGIDGHNVRTFSLNADKYLEELKIDLETGRYVSEPYYSMSVPKSVGSSEKRDLGLLSIRDKIAQQAVRNIIEPFFESIFLDISYGYRPRRGPARAIKRIKHMITHKKKTWVTICDIDKYFDTICHDILLEKVREKVAEPEILNLIILWIRMGHVDRDGKWKDKTQGVSQGGVLSPLLSNIYLHPFDLHMVNKKHGLIRYSDDFIILSNDESTAHQALTDAREFLTTRLALKLNPNPSIRSIEKGFTYMGIFFKGKAIEIDSAKFFRIKRKIKYLCSDFVHQPFYLFIKKMNEEIEGLINYYKPFASEYQFRNLSEYLMVQLSIMIQKKKDRGELKTRSQAYHELKKIKQINYTDYTGFKKYLNDILKRVSWQRSRSQLKSRSKARTSEKIPQKKHEKPLEKAPERKSPDSQTLSEPFETHGSAQQTQLVTKKSGGTVQQTHKVEHKVDICGKKDEKSIHKKPASIAAAQQVEQKVQRKKREYYKKRVLTGNIVISNPYHYLGRKKGRLVIKKGRKTVKEIALSKIEHISVSAPGISLSSDLVSSCAERKIPIDFFDFKGEPKAKIFLPQMPDTDVSLAQLRALDSDKCYTIASIFVQGKINNQINVLKYFLKYRKTSDTSFARTCEEAIEKMEKIMEKIPDTERTKDLDLFRNRLLGQEAAAATFYWDVVKILLEDDVEFEGRVRQGAEDPVNCSLNYGYGILYPRIWQAVIEAGLNPMISFLHKEQKGKPTLTYDLIEEFRPFVVDRTVFALFTRGCEIKMSNKFISTSSRKLVAESVITRLSAPLSFRGTKTTVDEIISHQTKSLASYLVGKKRRIYNPFVGRY